jgi:hypothetical protein
MLLSFPFAAAELGGYIFSFSFSFPSTEFKMSVQGSRRIQIKK